MCRIITRCTPSSKSFFKINNVKMNMTYYPSHGQLWLMQSTWHYSNRTIHTIVCMRFRLLLYELGIYNVVATLQTPHPLRYPLKNKDLMSVLYTLECRSSVKSKCVTKVSTFLDIYELCWIKSFFGSFDIIMILLFWWQLTQIGR